MGGGETGLERRCGLGRLGRRVWAGAAGPDKKVGLGLGPDFAPWATRLADRMAACRSLPSPAASQERFLVFLVA